VARREADGSVGIAEDSGAARSIAVGRIEVRTAGARGRRTWEPLTARAGRAQQLCLLDETWV